MKKCFHFLTPFSYVTLLFLLFIALPDDRVYAQWSDSTFSNANWTSTIISNLSSPTAQCKILNSSGVTTCQCGQDSIGNPTPSRKTCHSYSWPPYPAAIWVAHLYQPAFYNPATQGAITGLSYSYDLRQYTATGQNVTYRLLVFQNFTYYESSTTDSIAVNTWTTFLRTNLTAANFVKISGPPSTPKHPDFSCRGSVIQFGYLTGNSNTNPTVSAIDNWGVDIINGATCPCPQRIEANLPANQRLDVNPSATHARGGGRRR